MNAKQFQPIIFVLGLILAALSAMMVPPLLLDYLQDHNNWQAFALAFILTAFMAALMIGATFGNAQPIPNTQQTFLVTTLAWLFVAVFAGIPFIFTHTTSSLTDAYFEVISGITTTGATVIVGLDYASRGILLWRAILQWLGGVGIIVMAMTVMPILKIGGMQLFRNEFSDRSEKILPRVSQMANGIIVTYVFFTSLCVLFLRGAGMEWFDAICYGLSTISTGGFATHDNNMAHYNNVYIELIVMIFMLLGGVTFMLFVRFVHGDRKSLFKDRQIRTYLMVFAAATLVMSAYRVQHQGLDWLDSLRQCSFSVASILTTSGFTNHDITLWGAFPVMIFICLMTIGGCTGSTSGGVKVFRYQIMWSVVKTHLQQLRRPHGVFLPTYNNKKIPEGVFTSVFTFCGAYCLSLAGLSLALSYFDLDFLSAFSAATTALNNVGPGLTEALGPMGSFSPLPTGAKWLMMGGMILGRLEYLTVFVLLTPSFWRP